MSLRIDSFDYDANDQPSLELPPGSYKALYLYLTGTNETGATITRANLGDVRFIRGASTIWEASLERLWGAVDLLYRGDYGKQRFTSTISAAYEMSFVIPFHVPGDNSVLQVLRGDRLQFNHSSLTAITLDARMVVFGRPAVGIQNYFPIWRNFSVQAEGAVVEPQRFSRRNLQFLTLDHDANHSNVRLSKDGRLIYDEKISGTAADSEAAIRRPLEMPGFDTYGVPDSAFNPHIFRLDKEGWVEAVGDEYGLSVVSTSATANGLSLELRLDDTIRDLTEQGYLDRVRANLIAGGSAESGGTRVQEPIPVPQPRQPAGRTQRLPEKQTQAFD